MLKQYSSMMATFIARVNRQRKHFIVYFYIFILIFPKSTISIIIINVNHYVALNEERVLSYLNLLRLKLFGSLLVVRAFRVSNVA